MIADGFLRRNAALLSAGFLLAMSSSFGQTYFIALFAGFLREQFSLSHGGFGGLYTVATLSSAATLAWLGGFADRMPLRTLGALTLVGLAATAVAMAAVQSAAMLLVVIFGLRLCGQGMLSHLAMTAMARWFDRHRGRALSVAALGFPAGEAVFPVLAAVLLAVVGWRATWLVAAALLASVSLPALIWLLRSEPAVPAASGGDGSALEEGRNWTRAQVLRDPLFYLVLGGVLAPPFTLTGVFFHQVHLVETKGWSLVWFAGNFPVYAGATVLASLISGWVIDAWRASRLLPGYLVPMAAGLTLLAVLDSPWAVPLFMALCGMTSGSAITLLGALWVELYGVRHLGAIRALAVSAMVVATALAPGLMGLLIDHGVAIEAQLLAMSLYAAGYTAILMLAGPALRRAGGRRPER